MTIHGMELVPGDMILIRDQGAPPVTWWTRLRLIFARKRSTSFHTGELMTYKTLGRYSYRVDRGKIQPVHLNGIYEVQATIEP